MNTNSGIFTHCLATHENTAFDVHSVKPKSILHRIINFPLYNMSCVMRKPTICICENKDADQLRSNREADQHLCFRFLDSTIPLLSKYKISSL